MADSHTKGKREMAGAGAQISFTIRSISAKIYNAYFLARRFGCGSTAEAASAAMGKERDDGFQL